MTGKVLISFAVALSAIVSTIVDLLPVGHVYNPGWNPHAVFHDVVMFLLLDWMAVVWLCLLWRKSSESLVGVTVATLLVVGFWFPFYYVTTLFPMASLSVNVAEIEKTSMVIADVRFCVNVMIGTAMIAIALVGYWLYRKDAVPDVAATSA